LGNMRSNVERTATRHESSGVIALAARDGDPARSAQFLRIAGPGLALGAGRRFDQPDRRVGRYSLLRVIPSASGLVADRVLASSASSSIPLASFHYTDSATFVDPRFRR
jgi:hypothetical protein